MLSSNLKFCAWNIQGYNSREIGNKLKDRDFMNAIKKFDFVGITETHLHNEIIENLSLPGYKCLSYKNRKKNLKSNTAPGGIAVFVREHLTNLFSVEELGNDDAIWIKLKKDLVGEDKDTYIATCYFNPSKGQIKEHQMSELTENVLLLQNRGRVLINGDLNARTGNLDDTILPDKSDNQFDIPINEPPPKRNSQDGKTNPRGLEMLDICKSLDLNIVNGRKTGDLFGNYTCYKYNGSSVVDYLLTSASLFQKISLLKVGDFIPWLSDHCPIYFTLELNQNAEKSLPEVPKTKAPETFVWSDTGKLKFIDMLRTAEFQNKLDNSSHLNYAEPESVVNFISDSLIEAAKKAKIKTRKKRVDQDPPWFDKSCKDIKKEIKLLGREIKGNPKKQSLQTQLTSLKKELKRKIKRNKLEYKNNIVEKMNYSKKDGKKFWKLLDKLERKDDDTVFKEGISAQRWTSHFKAIWQGPEPNLPLPLNTAELGPLDYEITEEEVLLGAYILRNGKATGHDQISNEMLCCLLGERPQILTKLFNALLQNPSTIQKWHISMINPIHKSGSKMDTDNYRGISLLSCFLKLFLSILNKRITKFVIDSNILSKAQLGFLAGSRTSDALLILHNLIDYYCKKGKQYIFGCFVDFQKAFDSVPRHTLFQKLLNHNINGKFYDCLTKIYTDDLACIKVGNTLTKPFKATQGVKQGCILSPILFNIFLSDLQSTTEQAKCEPVQIAENAPLGCLIWADDLLLLSQSEMGLKTMLAELKSYTEKNSMKLNIKKTKVMIFNKSTRHIRRNIYFGGNRIETTRQYKYLGFMVTPSGEITTGLKDLKDRAFRALAKMKNQLGDFFRKCPQITLKLFKSLVEPILLYASDFWGILKPPQNNPIENVHLSFCKQLLGVQKQTTNIGVLLELGEIPLNLLAKKHAIKNWARITNNTRCNNMIISSHENAISQNLTWPKTVENTISRIGMRDVFLNKDKNSHVKVFERMKDIFYQESFADILRENSKLRTFSLLKNTIGMEDYLNVILNTKEHTSFTKLRLSNHGLMIEKGRHLNVDKHLRFCPFCPQVIETEVHFLLECRCLSILRTELFEKIYEKLPPFRHLDNEQMFVLLMSDKDLIPLTAKYAFRMMNVREFLIENHKGND